MENFRAKLAEYDLFPENIIISDKIQRFKINGNGKSGWYFFNQVNSDSYGGFGDWSRGISEPYSSFTDGKTEKEIKKIKEDFERIKKESEQLRKKEAEDVAIKAQEMWTGLKEGSHPYLTKKKIKAHGARRFKNSLVVPIYKNGKIVSLQFIDSSGKRFMSGGEVSGGAYVIKGLKEYVVICEGFSTGASIFESTGYQTFIAFNAGNLSKVAKRVSEIMPGSKIIIACDNDRFKKINIGVEKGTQAAELINCILAIPEFKTENEKHTDFNDLYLAEGKEEVERQIMPEKSDLEKSIKEWCLKFNGSFTTTELLNHFGIKDKQQKTEVDNILSNLCNDNIIQKDGKKRSVFRVVDTDIKTMKVVRCKNTDGVNIILPFGLSESVILEDRNIVIVAGESNAGKTALFLENMMDNILGSNQFDKPVYISSEMSQSEFSNRALLLHNDTETWNQAEIIDKSTNFQDAISVGRSDKLVYIDLLESSSDVAYSDMESILKQIRDSLTSGVAMVAMQKTKGNRLARGGDGTLSKARLYISLHHCYKGVHGTINRAVIEKCKMVRDGFRNPEGQQIFYQITKQGGIMNVTNWNWTSDIDGAINRIKRKNPEVGNSYEDFQFQGDYKT